MASPQRSTSHAVNVFLSAQPIGSRVKMIGLLVMVVVTGLALGSTTSYWLVPLYLVLMGWLLLGSPAQPMVHKVPSPHENLSPLVEVAAEVAPNLEVPAETHEAEAPAKKPRKTRSRGSRPRKTAKVEAVAPRAMATWVEVAPGSFMRVEIPVEPEDPQHATLDEIPPQPEDVVGEDVPAIASEPSEPEAETSEPEDVADRSTLEDAFVEPEPLGDLPFIPEAPLVVESEYVDSEEETTTNSTEPEGCDGNVSSSFSEARIEARLPELAAPDREHSLVEPPTKPDAPAAPRDPAETTISSCEMSRHVPRIRFHTSGVMRSSRPRKNARPLVRRPSGRIGAVPRVVLHRA